ncbi:delta-1-pyrroline-5-carboxylate synthase-like [Anthonomus grandis grandis]|uniref:delta-1-pyrroline-5-carboxylate synthase-like n=1 Tax=Anthonomus grandis grandis TaxID=2921223 RepID=UPI00216519C7|nr:delta-1-pyrroline-5-carboxylate synthase-like [Anthonomus grandis grandis]
MALSINLKSSVKKPSGWCQCTRLLTEKKPKKEECKPLEHKRLAYPSRDLLKNAKRIMVKFGSAVIIQEKWNKIAMSRLANLIEQMVELHEEGKEILFITSGSVAHGRSKLGEKVKVQSGTKIDKKPAAAVGQPGLMFLYKALFSKFDIQCAQVLVTEADIYQDNNRKVLKDVLNHLLQYRVIPILNTNDAVLPQPEIPCPTLCEGIALRDNDSLAAILSTEIGCDLLMILSTIDGVFTKDPEDPQARIIHNFSKDMIKNVEFGKASNVGLGGMQSKIASSLWAVDHGTSVVVANGLKADTLKAVLSGKKIGTFFRQPNLCDEDNTEIIAASARLGGRALSLLTGEERAACINHFAELLDKRVPDIMAANKKDLEDAKKIGLSNVLIGRLTITPPKIKALSVGLRQIADNSKTIVGKVVRRTLLAEGLELTQITVPIGVILVIFEARPDVLPQIAALAIASGNGLVLKGGDEAVASNFVMKSIVDEALKSIKCDGAIGLVSTKEEIADLINLDQYIDLIIPRGGYKLIRFIQNNAKRIPVMGHSEGICHIYVDKDACLEKCIKILIDAKTDYPTACNAVETLLLHKDLMEGDFFAELCCNLKNAGVKINSGPNLSNFLQFGPPLAATMKKEYGALEMCIEVVSSVEEAISHIHKYGSGHTESIITENKEIAEVFLKSVDSACVFHNTSTRMSDGFRFGLGAEVGISTARIHARGPVGIEGLLTTKWVLRSQCAHTASEFNEQDGPKWIHKSLPLDNKKSC